eukprot:1894041-Prymnesium_polylepis.1
MGVCAWGGWHLAVALLHGDVLLLLLGHDHVDLALVGDQVELAHLPTRGGSTRDHTGSHRGSHWGLMMSDGVTWGHMGSHGGHTGVTRGSHGGHKRPMGSHGARLLSHGLTRARAR